MKKYLSNISIMIVIAMIVLTSVQNAYAIGTTFTSSLFIAANDVANPSVPLNLTTNTISSSQINLTWDASTDDVAVAGYRIFRDSVIVSTTTAIYYSDTSLSPSTAYSYTVEAFDSAMKYSGQSDVAIATTSEEVVIPTPTPTPSSSPQNIFGISSGSRNSPIYNLTILRTHNSANIKFYTSESARTKIYWGITKDYEIGSASELLYGTNHSFRLDDLLPNTKYYFKIDAVDVKNGNNSVDGSFVTKTSLQESSLTNANDFVAIPSDKNILLSWKNPASDIFDSVRLVRSDKFFPRDINDGEPIYEGSGEEYIDNSASIGTTYYYSLFAKDKDGNYSSGALAFTRIKVVGEIENIVPKDYFENIKVIDNVAPEIAGLKIYDFDFFQDSIKLTNLGNGIIIDGGKNLKISLDYNKVPEILKTIAVTLIDPDDSTKVFPFLLRVNKEKTAYEATLAPLGRSGIYKMNIIVLDYKNQGLKRIEGSLKALVFEKFDGVGRGQGDMNRNLLILIGLMSVVVFLRISFFKKIG